MREHAFAQNKEEINPHFVSEESKTAEKRLRVLLEAAKDLGVEILSLSASKETILEEVRKGLSKRYELVVQKLQEEGLSLSELSREVLIDRMLGIDMLFKFEGKIYSVDVTTGKSSVIINKQRKIKEMEEVYKRLGINHALILKLKEDITNEMVLDLFSKLEEWGSHGNTFTVALRYPVLPARKNKSLYL